MKRASLFGLLIVAAMVLSAASCLVTENPDGTVSPGPLPKAIGIIAPFIPGPWGAVAAAASTALVGVGSLLAKRQVNDAMKAGGEASRAAVNPLSKLLSERKYLVPLLAVIPMLGKAFNLWDLNWDAMLATLAAAGVAVGADVYESKKANGAPPPAVPTGT